jgi:hypothetical protein
MSAELEVRWLVDTPAGPVVVRVQTHSGRFVASLDAPPPALRFVTWTTGHSADEALRRMIDEISGTGAIPLHRPR